MKIKKILKFKVDVTAMDTEEIDVLESKFLDACDRMGGTGETWCKTVLKKKQKR